VCPVDGFQLKLDSGQPIAEIRALLCKHVLIYLTSESQIQEAILLHNKEGLLCRGLASTSQAQLYRNARQTLQSREPHEHSGPEAGSENGVWLDEDHLPAR
jgi:hypothetical protein